ncbi:hypothetical protein JOM56_015312 [Amanita muscaria]
MPSRTRSRNRRSIERPCHVDNLKNDDSTSFMRREWKYNKPHLRRSDSLPTLSILPSTRPHFTCRQCHFTNTVIPMCLWCCWTSKESEALFEKSMPRARRMSAPMRISSAVETPRKRRITEANSGSGPKREVTGGVVRVDAKEPTKDGLSNPVVSLNRFLPGRGYGRETPNGDSHDISDGRGSAADTRIEIVSRKRGASCSQTGFVSGAAGIEGRLGPRRSGAVGEGDMVVQKGVGQTSKYPIKAKSCVDISQPSKSGKLCESIPPAEATPSTINARPLLPLRLRRLKEVATPLQIDSQAKIPMTHATYSISSPQSHTTTKTPRKSPLSPKIFRRVHDFSISRSPSKWPSCISDAETNDVEDNRPIMIPSVQSRSNLTVQTAAPESRGTLLPMIRNATKTTPGQFYPAYSITPPSPRSPWSKSDPFGELLGLSTDTTTCATPNPTFSLTTVSTIPTPTTPDIPGRASLTRHRAATVSGYDQSTSFSPNPYNPYPITPTSPSSSVYSFSGHPPKPLYASIRKDGMYLSPLSSPRLQNSSSKPAMKPTPVDRVTCDANNLSKRNNMERLPHSPYPSLYPCSPQPSPLSPVFSPSITPAVYDDANLSSLSLESRSSSTEGSCGGDGIYVDAFEPPKGGYGGGHKSGIMARWTKPRRKFDGNTKVKTTRTRPRSRDRSIGKEDVGISAMGSTSNPSLMNQRLFRVPFALAGASGCGCSMSGETELKLALRARAAYEDGIPPGQDDDLASKAKLPGVDEATMGEKSSLESQTKPSAGPLMRRLREMVSTGFLRHGDGE